LSGSSSIFWFVGLGVDDPLSDATTFTKNRDRLLADEVAMKFLAAALAQPKVKALLSSEHFSADGTLIIGFSPKSMLAKYHHVKKAEII
jgi:hypothetical protein